MSRVLRETRVGFNTGLFPVAGKEGVSGNYFLRNKDKRMIAIFKPIDEEAFAPNNPKGYSAPFGSKSFRNGILSGEAASREVAAYILDNKGIHKVPETTYVEMYHTSFEPDPHFSMMGNIGSLNRQGTSGFKDNMSGISSLVPGDQINNRKNSQVNGSTKRS